MSRQNKVNKGNYVQAGRLTPDDLAREREKTGKRHDTRRATGTISATGRSAERASSQGRNVREE